MNGNDDDIINRVRRALGRCFTRRCRRVRRALGYANNHNSNNENERPYIAEQTRKRRQSMTNEEIRKVEEAARLVREKYEAERKMFENRAYMNASRNHWARQAEEEEAAEVERRAMEEERRKQEAAEVERRAMEEARRRAMEEARRRAMEEELRRKREEEVRRAMEEEFRRKREAYEAREQARRQAEEEARNAAERERARRMPPPPAGPVDCNELLRNLGILDDDAKINKKVWMKWLIANHPDKFPGVVGEQKKIIDERFKLVYACYESVRKQSGGRKRTQKRKSNKRVNKA